jgi:hypothetical protein
VSYTPAGSRGQLLTAVSLVTEVFEERLSVPVNSDFPLICLALPGVEHGLISRRHGRRNCVETTVSITVSHTSSLPSLAVPDNCLLGGGFEPVWGTQGRLWDLGWTGALFLTEICCTRAETMGPIWGQRVGPVDPTRLIRHDGSGLISTNGSGRAARPSEKRKVAGSIPRSPCRHLLRRWTPWKE